MINEVTMYRVVCDADGCGASSPSDLAEFSAWAEVGQALDDAVEEGGWYVGARGHLCHQHVPRCVTVDCNVRLRDDDFGALCEDCFNDADLTPPVSPSEPGLVLEEPKP